MDEIKTYEAGLTPLQYDDGIFVQVDENIINYTFSVVYTNLDPKEGDLYLKLNTKLDVLKRLPKLFRNAVIMPENNDVSWEEATNYKNVKKGHVFRSTDDTKRWIVSTQIGLTLIKDDKVSPIKKTPSANKRYKHLGGNGCLSALKSSSFTKSDKDTIKERICTNTTTKTIINNKEKWGEAISEKKSTPHEEKNTNTSKEQKSETNINLCNQYLMSGREDEPFFYEGSTSDASGASFKIEYESSSMKGLYSLIVDMNNLRTINPGFRREVIKIENNGTTIREASAFTIVSKGEAHFSKEDSVWIVDKPLVIKLLK